MRAPRVGRPFSLELADLDQHVSILGATGSGKTTTVSRFMDAALGAGWAVTVLDAKGGNLAETVRRLGQRHQVEAAVWLPGAADSSTYDVCAGDAAAVSNRLLGAFEHGRDGEVYRQLSQALLPLFVRALEESGKPWDLETLRASLNRARLVGLARKVPDEALRTRAAGDARGRAAAQDAGRACRADWARCATVRSARTWFRRTERSTWRRSSTVRG